VMSHHFAICMQLKWSTIGASENDAFQLFKVTRPADSAITVQGACGQQGSDMSLGHRSSCNLWTACGEQGGRVCKCVARLTFGMFCFRHQEERSPNWVGYVAAKRSNGDGRRSCGAASPGTWPWPWKTRDSDGQLLTSLCGMSDQKQRAALFRGTAQIYNGLYRRVLLSRLQPKLL
jgi:hypothetical protein